MARDTSLQLRQAVIETLRADTVLTNLVPEDQNYGMRTPAKLAWPFTRYGAPDAVPFKGQCLDGAVISFSIHSFSKETFEDELADINFAVSSALDGVTLALGGDFSADAHIRWVGSQIIPDAAEASAWHGINRFEATVAS
jgi:hypothetical protein